MAKAMVALKSDRSGTLVLVAQPAEELIPGAQAMIDDGFHDKHGVPVPHDHVMVAEGVGRLIEESATLVGRVSNGHDLVEAARRLQPDIVSPMSRCLA